MSDRATLWRLLQEHKEDAILRLFDIVQNEHDAQVAALQAALDAAINMNIEKNAEVVRLTAALAAANEDAARLASVLSDDGKLPPNAKRLSLAAHRARVGDIL